MNPIQQQYSCHFVSVNEVEHRSGLDFFWELDDALETILESVPGDWPLN